MATAPTAGMLGFIAGSISARIQNGTPNRSTSGGRQKTESGRKGQNPPGLTTGNAQTFSTSPEFGEAVNYEVQPAEPVGKSLALLGRGGHCSMSMPRGCSASDSRSLWTFHSPRISPNHRACSIRLGRWLSGLGWCCGRCLLVASTQE